MFYRSANVDLVLTIYSTNLITVWALPSQHENHITYKDEGLKTVVKQGSKKIKGGPLKTVPYVCVSRGFLLRDRGMYVKMN